MPEEGVLARELMQILGQIKKSSFKEKSAHVFHGELAVLHCIIFEFGEDEDITPSSISNSLSVARPTVTAALNNLEKKGYVFRKMSKHDRRRTIVKITEKGKQFIEDKHNAIRTRLNVLTEGLGEENSKELIRLLRLSFDIMNTFGETN